MKRSFHSAEQPVHDWEDSMENWLTNDSAPWRYFCHATTWEQLMSETSAASVSRAIEPSWWEDSSAEQPDQYEDLSLQRGSTASSCMAVWPFGAVRNIIDPATFSSFFSPGANMPQILAGSSPQSLLRLSAGSRALYRYATCDDVNRGVIYGSLSADSFASVDPSILVAEDSTRKTLIT